MLRGPKKVQLETYVIERSGCLRQNTESSVCWQRGCICDIVLCRLWQEVACMCVMLCRLSAGYRVYIYSKTTSHSVARHNVCIQQYMHTQEAGGDGAGRCAVCRCVECSRGVRSGRSIAPCCRVFCTPHGVCCSNSGDVPAAGVQVDACLAVTAALLLFETDVIASGYLLLLVVLFPFSIGWYCARLHLACWHGMLPAGVSYYCYLSLRAAAALMVVCCGPCWHFT